MEQMVMFGGRKVLLTTAADRDECQAQEWWDEADIVLSVDSYAGPARILKASGQQQVKP